MNPKQKPRVRNRNAASLGLALVLLGVAGCGGEEPEAKYIVAEEDQLAPTEASSSTAQSTAQRSAPEAPPGPMTKIEDQNLMRTGLDWRLPEGWTTQTPSNSMRVIEFVPAQEAPEGQAPIAAVVSYWGPQGAGTTESNIARWRGQLQNPRESAVEEFESNGLSIAYFTGVGTFLSGMPGSEPTPMENWMLLAAKIDGSPVGPSFIRLAGPEDIVRTNKARFEQMLRSIHQRQTKASGHSHADDWEDQP